MASRQGELFPLIRQAQTALALGLGPEPARPKGPTKLALTGAAIALLKALESGEAGLYSRGAKGERFERPFTEAGKELARTGLVFMREELAPSQFAWDISDKGRTWLRS